MSSNNKQSTSQLAEDQVEINFESHPPIEEDLPGITTLLKQILLPNVNLSELANYIIRLKNISQIIATEAQDEEDEGDEPDDDIYGVISLINLGDNSVDGEDEDTVTKKGERSVEVSLRESLISWSSHVEKLLSAKQKGPSSTEAPVVNYKLGYIINERYVNLPPQLALPSLQTLTESLNEYKFTHLVLVSKIMVKHMSNSKNKKFKGETCSRSQAPEDTEIIYVNPEEEIIFENCSEYSDIDVSKQCDESACWTMGSDAKYMPHRRIMIIEYSNWPKILELLAKELKQ